MGTYAIIIVTSILFGLICATIASKKNRDPLLWFLVGAILNVLALGAIAFLEKRGEKNERKLNWEKGKKILKWGLVVVVGLFAFISLIALASIFFPFMPGRLLEFLISIYFKVINPLTMKIVSATAIDVWIARALAFTFYAVAPYMLVEWLVRILSPINLFTKLGRFLIFISFLIMCISMSFLSKNVYFSQDGRPQKKYYIHTDGKVEFFPSEMGTHPVYGEPLKFVTREIIKEVELEKQGYRILTIESSPKNADVYLNWKYQGKTPLTITEQKVEGLLVVTLKGYMPQYKEILAEKNDTISLSLRPENISASNKFLIVIKQDLPHEDVSNILRTELLKQKISLSGKEEEREFRQRLDTLGGSTSEAFLAWARAKFAIDYVIFASAKYTTRELGKGDVGYERIQQSIQEMLREEVTLELEILDIRTGNNVFAFDSKAEDTVDKHITDLSGLLRQVCSQSARKIKQEVL